MNTYKEKYELLIKEIEEIKIKLNKQRNLKEIKDEEYYGKIQKIVSEKKMELFNLENERDKIINSKDDLIRKITEVIVIIVGGIALYSGVRLYSAINPLGIIRKIITGVGLTSIVGSLWLTADLLIIGTHDWFKKKIRNKNKMKPESIDLTKKINKKNKELKEAEEKQTKLLTEIEEIKKEIINTDGIMKLKSNELELLKNEIVASAINEQVVTQEAIEENEIIKPYTRIKTKEN